MPRPYQIFSQSDYLIQIVDINSHSDWQTVQIQISWLLQKPTDLDLHCLQRQGISGLSRTRVNVYVPFVFPYLFVWYNFSTILKMFWFLQTINNYTVFQAINSHQYLRPKGLKNHLPVWCPCPGQNCSQCIYSGYHVLPRMKIHLHYLSSPYDHL